MDVAIRDVRFQSYEIEGGLVSSHWGNCLGFSHACEIQLDDTELLGENIWGLQCANGLRIVTDETDICGMSLLKITVASAV